MSGEKRAYEPLKLDPEAFLRDEGECLTTCSSESYDFTFLMSGLGYKLYCERRIDAEEKR